MYYTIKRSTAALCTAAMVTKVSAEANAARSVQFTINQVANPKYTGSSGVWSMAKTYSKYNKAFPSGLKNAISEHFPKWGE
jgi:hypothetical protein